MPTRNRPATTTWSTPERRAFDRLLTPGGNLLILAADQRNSMKALMSSDPVTNDQLSEAKYDLASHLAVAAPAVLFDPEIALPGMVDDAALPAQTALVVGLDASGYQTDAGLRYTQVVPGMTAAKVRHLGGDAAKMLYYVRPDQQDAQSRVADEIRALVEEFSQAEILLIVEILVYRLPDEDEAAYAQALPGLILDSARLAVECGAKVLKIQYPGSVEASQAVAQAVGDVPWAVLSAGVDHETFLGQIRSAMAGGASGAMAGRSVWKDSVPADAAARRELLASRARPRLAELQQALDASAAE